MMRWTLLLVVFSAPLSAMAETTIGLHVVGTGDDSLDLFRVEMSGPGHLDEFKIHLGADEQWRWDSPHERANSIDQFHRSREILGMGQLEFEEDAIAFVEHLPYYDDFEDEGSTLVVDLKPQSFADGDSAVFESLPQSMFIDHENIIGKQFTAILEDGRQATATFSPNGMGDDVTLRSVTPHGIEYFIQQSPQSTAMVVFGAAVPEPASCVLLALALASGLLLRRRPAD